MSHVPPASPPGAAGNRTDLGATAGLESTPPRGHPPGLYLLFMVEMWERFSYYGMRALLVLYLTAVIAAHEIPGGKYVNELVFTEIQQVDGKDVPAPKVEGKEVRDGHVQTVQLVVGSGSPTEAPMTSTGSPVLQVQRLKQAPDPKDPKKTVWIVDEAPAGSPTVQTDAGKRPANGAVGFRFSNTTDVTYKVVAEFRRPKDGDQRTFFTLNDAAGSTTVIVKPDAERKPNEAPADIIVATNNHQSGRNWSKAKASTLYGWYTGLAYLFPILGGLIADKLIGTHRSMLVGGVLISIGHIILAVSGIGGLAQSDIGMSVFVAGLAVIVLGTGHFKPNVSVMVGQLYPPGDPRRDGAFTIFYMGINLGAFLCAFVCGTLGEKVGWHWGFGSAAVGMLLGLGAYLMGRPKYLAGIGEAPRPDATSRSMAFFVGALILSALTGAFFLVGGFGSIGTGIEYLQNKPALGWAVVGVLISGTLLWAASFVMKNRPEDRGPVVTIFIFMIFNAFFWIAFEQAGTSINLFTKENTDRTILGLPEIPASWFQSVNAGLIFLMAPMFAALWTGLGRRRMNPSQPMKIALGLLFLGFGYVFMVWAGKVAIEPGVKASMLLIFMTYFWHTVGELCLSPTGLSYVTKAAPVRFVSLLMGIWFVSSFIANLGGGLVAGLVESIEKGELKTPWSFGGQADFFFLFVVSSVGAGLLIMILTPFLKKLMRSPTD
jgi:proton-dependent oligopeptide transporter, POT family